jgi:hypothetical protein
VCTGQVEVLDFSNPSEWLKNFVARSAQSWRVLIIRDYREGRKECMQEFLRILEFAARIKLRRDRDLEEFKGRTRVEVTSQKSSSGGKTPSYLARSL